MAQISETIDEFREGLSEEDLEEIFWAMNVEHVNPDDLNAYNRRR